MQLGNLKSILSILGINRLSVKFDAENKLIRTIFEHKGENTEETITFEQIEQLFSEGQEGRQDGAGRAIAGETIP